MKRAAFLLSFLLLIIGVAACAGGNVGPSASMTYFHDADHQVSCWSIGSLGMDCLPDSQVHFP